MSRTRFWALPLAAAGLAGCVSLDPVYVRPAAPVPAQLGLARCGAPAPSDGFAGRRLFSSPAAQAAGEGDQAQPGGGGHAGEGAGAGPGFDLQDTVCEPPPSAAPPPPPLRRGGEEAAPVAWSQFFTDPRLREVVRLALAQNRDLRVAALNIVEARARFNVQRAALLPTVTAGASAAYEKVAAATTGGVGGVGGGRYSVYSADAGFLGYELDLFGRVRSLSRAAYETYLATAQGARATRISLVAEVATDYLTLAADTERLTTERRTLAAETDSLELAQSRFRFGVASQLDVRQAQIAVESSNAAIATYTTQAVQDRDALDLVAGATVARELLPQGQSDALATLADAPSELDSAVLLQRPDVLEAEHTLKAAGADIGAARAAFFPSIALTAQAGASSLSLGSLFAAGTGAYTFAPSVALPIFDGGARRANLILAKATRDAAVAAYEKAIQSAFRDVADALAQRATVAALIGAQSRLVEAAQGALQLAQARYMHGSDTYLNVLNAQLSVASARQALIGARLTRAANLVSLYRGLGGGSDLQP